eukprot:3230473-Pleurochrysis_carterae.AAC.2
MQLTPRFLKTRHVLYVYRHSRYLCVVETVGDSTPYTVYAVKIRLCYGSIPPFYLVGLLGTHFDAQNASRFVARRDGRQRGGQRLGGPVRPLFERIWRLYG